jgi:hypothetical protein
MRDALQQFHIGNLNRALELLNQIGSSSGTEDDDVVFYRRQILNRLDPPIARDPVLIWRERPPWELDWLGELLPPMLELDRETPLEQLAGRPLVIIDNRIKTEKIVFYRQAYEAGCQITLIHLSDEAFDDDYGVYRWCKSVFRNCYSPLLRQQHPSVLFFALGFKSGFADNLPPMPLASRPNVWSFAGDPNKTTRRAMLNAMQLIGGGDEHLTSGFNSSDSLSTNDYREMMNRSIFIPCPQGFINLDSFRVYEALEAGCIPIVEQKPGFDYFAELLGPYPFPSVFHWDEAVTLVKHLLQHGLAEPMASSCQRWWRRYKISLRDRIAVAIR